MVDGRSLSPFIFELNETAVDPQLQFYVENGKPTLVMNQGQTASFPITIISAASEPTPVDWHVTIGNEQVGPIKLPQGVNIKLEPDHMLLKPDENQIILITVIAAEKAPSNIYNVQLVGEWPEFNGFSGTSFSLHVGQDSDNSEWQTLELVGKYTNSQPPKPDQTFIVQYRVTNATLESVDIKDGLEFVANTIEKGILEVKFPRNYPYANFADREGFYLSINGYGTEVYYLPETTPMMDHVRPKIINDINRPPPHPYTFSEKTNCHFIFNVPFYTFAKIEIGYGGNGLIPSPYYGDDVPEYCIKETIVYSNNNKRYQSPHKQIQEGTELYSINCNEGLYRAIRQNEKPACLSLETFRIFFERNQINHSGLDFEKIALDSARDFILSSPTFSYDGMKESLAYSITAIRESLPPIITVDARFTNYHPGYGSESNRKDLTENWSQHYMQIGISGVGDINSAIIDMEWDEMNQKFLN